MTPIERSYAARLTPRLSILALGLFVVGTNAFVIAGLLPSIAATLGVTTSDVSYSITLYAVEVAVLAPLISIFLARMSRTTLMSAGLALVAVGTVLAAEAPDLSVFVAGRVIAGLGGAALVPTATAAAAALAAPERRGRAIAFVAVGFTAAVAFGAPLGTALASVGGWRAPLSVLAGLAALTAVAVALLVRRVPIAEPVSVARRFAVLGNPRILLALFATVFMVCGFNTVYIFSSAVTAVVTDGSGTLLAALLLTYGVAGMVGNVIGGRAIDRFGSRRLGLLALTVQAVVLVCLPLAEHGIVITFVLFAVWGITSNAAVLAVQHRLIGIDPATSSVSLSWQSTALYVGIALAPPLGATALGLGGAAFVPLAGALATALALIAFGLGWLRPRRAASDASVDGALSTSS